MYFFLGPTSLLSNATKVLSGNLQAASLYRTCGVRKHWKEYLQT